MRRFAILTLLLVASIAPVHGAEDGVIAIALHGGAGTISSSQLTKAREREYKETLGDALEHGYLMLEAGAASLDAVVATVRILEDSPLFNAGHGAVFAHDGRNELDASIMNGRTLAAGAVAGVRHVRNPIELARLVMERSPYVLLTGSGAEEFALSQGVRLVPAEYFHTRRRWLQLQEQLAAEHAGPVADLDTVGVVALDRNGNLAAGTSTGGLSGKRYGRVGDSPIIGAGTYADNASCAVSATGSGEFFIRGVVAYDVCALMRYAGLSLAEAAARVIEEKLPALGGDGGIVALDREGNVAMPFNTEGMYRAAIDGAGRRSVAIYR